MKKRWIAILCLACAGCLCVPMMVGCTVAGRRQFTMKILGSEFAITDEAIPDLSNGGKAIYTVDFTEFGKKLWDVLFGWMKPDDPPPPDGSTVTVAGAVVTEPNP